VWQLTNLDKHVIVMALREEWLKPMYNRVECWTTQIALNLVRLSVDTPWFGEDLGSQNAWLVELKRLP